MPCQMTVSVKSPLHTTQSFVRSEPSRTRSSLRALARTPSATGEYNLTTSFPNGVAAAAMDEDPRPKRKDVVLRLCRFGGGISVLDARCRFPPIGPTERQKGYLKKRFFGCQQYF